MEINDLQGKLIAVLGYGVEGKAVTWYLIKHGIKPVLFDQKPWAQWPADEQQAIKNLEVNFIFGPDYLKEFKGFDLAFRSPGIPLSTLHPSPFTLITSQTQWFFEHCPAKIIGVTGTKGKGTTCALIYGMLKADGQNVELTGNIGKIQPLEILDNSKINDWVVYELSSFQLQDLTSSPHISVVLMVTSEHLDYHHDVAEYIEAKSAITKYQTADDITIYNNDYPASAKIGRLGNGKKLPINSQTILNFDISKLSLRGKHNLENLRAAVAAAKSAGCSSKAIEHSALEFKGLEHRLELVADKDQIKFYNDSFSTIPETAIAAIQSFSEPLVLILGGSSKNSDFTALGKIIIEAENIKALILIGQESDRIKHAIENAGKFKGEILTGVKTMAEIFTQIRTIAKAGDVVLLSPACASFDMFKSYKDRGEQFRLSAKQF